MDAGRTFVVRSIAAADSSSVVEIFMSTMALGRPLPFELGGADAYARLCLGWFLGPEAGNAAVLEVDGVVAGYALVATDLAGHDRFQRTALGLLLSRLAAAALRGEISRGALRFWRLRARDAVTLRRQSTRAPAPVVAHLNLTGAVRAGAVGRRLIEHIDGRAESVGAGSWYGEMNAVVGRRAGVLTRYGVEVVCREPNHTLSWLVGRPVERLVTRRTLRTATRFAGAASLR